MHRYRSHTCGGLSAADIGQTARLSGWCHRVRDHGGVLFIDLRDHYGMTQIVVDPDSPAFNAAEKVRSEWVIRIDGKVRRRPAGTENANLATGEVEVFVTELEVLSTASELPLPVFGDVEYPEDTRLRYRFLDLRREGLHRNIMTRVAVIDSLRRRMKTAGFNEFQTPILTASSPEGARDFLVPSRIHPGKFYALPQSPQLFKQILMMAGFDRYYQIARCFRDEALRADRQLEFTQLDMEFAFVRERDVQDTVEGMIRDIFAEVMDVQLDAPFPRMTWAEAMRRYGSDKPDLRIALELVDVADLVKSSEFAVFTAAASDPDGRVAALRIPGGASLSRKQIDEYAAHAAKYGAKGLAYIKIDDAGEISSPIRKFFAEDAFAALVKHVGAGNGDIVFFGAGGYNKVSDFMGALRLKAGKDFGLVQDGWKPLWVTDFPMFEWDEDAQRYVALHHPFTAPAVDDIADLRANAKTAVSRGYDMVLNGNEIGGGSIRIHRPEMQSAVFELLGIGAEEAEAKFGFLLDALRFGAPPHGGIAFGIDRIAALMAGTESIRDVIPFPKTTTAQCLMTGAPSPIPHDQLAEVHIQVRPRT